MQPQSLSHISVNGTNEFYSGCHPHEESMGAQVVQYFGLKPSSTTEKEYNGKGCVNLKREYIYIYNQCYMRMSIVQQLST